MQEAVRPTAYDDGDLCPPYWPSVIWWLIHHGPPPADPQRERYDILFRHLAVFTFADGLKQTDLRAQALKGLQEAVQGLR